MYNRYIPGSNGAYERSVIQEPTKVPIPPAPTSQKECDKSEPQCKISRQSQFTPQNNGLDLGDLLLLCIILLILMDCEQDDQLSILLTAAAFLF